MSLSFRTSVVYLLELGWFASSLIPTVEKEATNIGHSHRHDRVVLKEMCVFLMDLGSLVKSYAITDVLIAWKTQINSDSHGCDDVSRIHLSPFSIVSLIT